MAMDTNETCYINLLHDDILANILRRLPEPSSIANCSFACKPWCHVINVHGILRRQRPPALCGVLREKLASCLGNHSLLFSPSDQIASPDLVEMTNDIPEDLAMSLPGGPWYIADSYEGLLLLHCRHIDSRRTNWRVLAIFNPITRDLQELPPTANSPSCLFVGAAILRDDAGKGRCRLFRGVPDVFTFKVVCVVAVDTSTPGEGNDECIIQILVHSAGPDDKWSCISHSGCTRWSICMMRDRVGDTLWKINAPHRPWATRFPRSANSTTVTMLNMRTGRSSVVAPPHVSHVLPGCCTFVEFGKEEDNKLWFVCIHDLLMLRLYSHPKPAEEESSSTSLGTEQWILERDVQLQPQMEELTNATGELRARNVRSRNGYVFFAMDEYGYFAVRLRSMHVQRLSGVPGNYNGRLYPVMLRQDL